MECCMGKSERTQLVDTSTQSSTLQKKEYIYITMMNYYYQPSLNREDMNYYTMKAWRRILLSHMTRMNILDHSTLNNTTNPNVQLSSCNAEQCCVPRKIFRGGEQQQLR